MSLQNLKEKHTKPVDIEGTLSKRPDDRPRVCWCVRGVNDDQQLARKSQHRGTSERDSYKFADRTISIFGSTLIQPGSSAS